MTRSAKTFGEHEEQIGCDNGDGGFDSFDAWGMMNGRRPNLFAIDKIPSYIIPRHVTHCIRQNPSFLKNSSFMLELDEKLRASMTHKICPQTYSQNHKCGAIQFRRRHDRKCDLLFLRPHQVGARMKYAGLIFEKSYWAKVSMVI